MIGEANLYMDRVRHGYDVILNQETRGSVARGLGIVDFPYTFVGPNCLETLMHHVLGRPPARTGVFIEINSFREISDSSRRSALAPFAKRGHALRRHHQNIRLNLESLYDSKYFVKSGGRLIRGNSVIEAISMGVLVLMNPAEIYHAQLLPPETWVHSWDEAFRLIDQLELDVAEYKRLQALQRARLRAFVVDAPMESLRNCLAAKRNLPPRPPRPRWRRIAAELRRRLRGDL